jgi:hypothetical protein
MVSVPETAQQIVDSDDTLCYEEEDSYMDEIPLDLDEQILRTVFCGIINGAKKRAM